jgi:ATP-dependent exoDNAse (exonuclease V) beta subunit
MKDPNTFVDAEARERIARDFDTTLFVEAAAGTGKTTALVGRIVALLRSGGAELDRIVAVTFTDKAAGEMKLRLRGDIERARQEAGLGVERERLDRALHALELARIGTIHAFCGDLLRERPVEAGVDPLFQVAPADESMRILSRAFDAWFERVLADPPEGVRRMLRRRPRGFNAQGPREALLVAARNLAEHPDFPAAFQRRGWEREASIDSMMECLGELAALAPKAHDPDDWLPRNLASIARFVDDNALREAVRGRDYDELEAKLRELGGSRFEGRSMGWKWKGRGREFGPDLPRDQVIAQRDALKAELDELKAAADADLAACLREDLREVVDDYQARKRAAGAVDFVDLLLCARDLIAGSPDVRAAYQQRFSHFFVDEFQDTDPLQAEILLLLAADDPTENDWREATPVPGKLFVVGDPKQSIYRFRRADVAIYERIKRRLCPRHAELLHLRTSFRSLPSIQEAVNAAFGPAMRAAPEGTQAEYVALEPAREEVPGRPTVVALPTPKPYSDYGRITNWSIERSLPDGTGAFVDWLVNESGWTVEERPGEPPVAVKPRHVCLLFRRLKTFGDDVTRPYVRALEARRVPHVLVGGRSFHEREEVLAIRNALAAIEWPDDELRAYATLRGPFFALHDDQLLAFRHRHGRIHPLLPVDAEKLAHAEREVAEALELLRGLHYQRNRRPIADTISRLLAAVRAHAGLAVWPTGEQALANCLRSVDLARRFERRGADSFRAFVSWLEAEAERGEAGDAPVVEEGTEGVRIMTAHRAKGLEFPVVILCDPTCKATRDQPSRHVDPDRGLWAEALCGCVPHDLQEHRVEELARDAAESVRLAYVAATRARDLLVVPTAAEDELPSGWLSPLSDAVFPDALSGGEGAPGPGCPPFGPDAVAERPRGARRGDRAPVTPGRLHPRKGRHAVVWWDPNALALDAQQTVGLRQQRILEADEGGTASGSIEAHARWQEARRDRLAHASRRSFEVAPVTTWAETLAEQRDARVEVEEVPGRDTTRPHGTRFGTLVHAVLAVIDLSADTPGVQASARLQGRLLGASDAEVEAAAAAVVGALAHPLLERAAGSSALRRETPLVLARDDGSLVEGVVDLAFREESEAGPRWTVVDFKTDRELREERRGIYAAQVGLYVEAISRATGENVEGRLLVV